MLKPQAGAYEAAWVGIASCGPVFMHTINKTNDPPAYDMKIIS